MKCLCNNMPCVKPFSTRCISFMVLNSWTPDANQEGEIVLQNINKYQLSRHSCYSRTLTTLIIDVKHDGNHCLDSVWTLSGCCLTSFWPPLLSYAPGSVHLVTSVWSGSGITPTTATPASTPSSGPCWPPSSSSRSTSGRTSTTRWVPFDRQGKQGKRATGTLVREKSPI